MMSPVLLKVENLTLISPAGTIIENFSFDIKCGEILALTGRSGSGKTSIAHAILDVLPPTLVRVSGRFSFRSKDGNILHFPGNTLQWLALKGKQIAFMQQDVFGAFDPVLKMGKQMMMILDELSDNVHHVRELKSTLGELGIAESERLWNSYPHQLSGGQLQRCLIAIAVVLKPLLLIADEPTSSIDKMNQVELLKLLELVRSKYGITILCISHEPAIVQYLADREVNLDAPLRQTDLHKDQPSQTHDVSKQPILQATALSHHHRYGNLKEKKGASLIDINFGIAPGQCIGVIGESGSGKSTFAQLLVGLFTPSSGQLILQDRAINFNSSRDIRYLRSYVQLVMQDGRGSLHPNKTIGSLLHEVIKFRGEKSLEGDVDDEVRHVLNKVGLKKDEVISKKAGSLSGGECLRVSIARALLMKPKILICDESTSALDHVTRDGITELLKSLIRSQEIGLIVISHDDEVVQKLSDEIMVFSEGQVVDKGTREWLSQSDHPVTKRILTSYAILSQKKHH